MADQAELSEWMPPPELRRPAPRAIRRRPECVSPALMVLVPAPMLLFLVAVYFGVSYQKSVLVHHGRTANGTIVALRGPSPKHPAFGVTYVYSTGAVGSPEAEEFEGRTSVTADELGALERSGMVEVIYNPATPSRSDLALVLRDQWRHPYRGLRLAILGLLTLLLFAAGSCSFQERLMLRQETCLLRCGKIAEARLAEPDLSKPRTARSEGIRYSFVDANDRIVTGVRRFSSRVADAGPIQARTVLFDPDRPSRNMLYPGRRFRC